MFRYLIPAAVKKLSPLFARISAGVFVRLLCLGLPLVATLHAARPTVEQLTELYLPPVYSQAKVSPTGEFIALRYRQGDNYAVAVFSLKTGKLDVLQRQDVIPLDFWWKGPQRLLVRSTDPTYRARDGSLVDVVSGKVEDAWQVRDIHGRIIDGLPNDPKSVLFSSGTEIGRFDLGRDDYTRVDGGDLGLVGRWVIDETGRARAAFTWHKDGTSLFQWNSAAGAKWQDRDVPADEKRFIPLGVSDNPRFIWGWDFGQGNEITISRFDTATGTREAVVRKAGLDPVFALVLQRTRRPVAVAYVEKTQVTLEALSESDRPAVELLQKRFAGFCPVILDQVPGSDQWLVWFGNSRVPGGFALFDTKTGAVNPFAHTHEPALTEDRFAVAEYFSFPSRNGGKLSARIWRPEGVACPPLVVICPGALPGHPAMDLYSHNTQALVALGYAVLRVNVRGTVGYGEASRAAATGDVGKAIAEDLEDAVGALGRQKLIDDKRVALLGWRLGGSIALQVASNSSRFAAVASVNAPVRVSRYALLDFREDSGISELATRLGGWFASGQIADELSAVESAPKVHIPALYLYDEDSAGGVVGEGGRVRRAAAKSGAPSRVEVAYGWSQYPKKPTLFAREDALLIERIADFFRSPPKLASR